MSISKRKGSPFWHYDFTVKGARFRGSTETEDRALAKDIEAKLRAQALEQSYLGRKPSITLGQAATRFWDESGQYFKSAHNALWYHLRHLTRGLGKETKLEDLTGDLLARYVAKARGERIKIKRKQNGQEVIAEGRIMSPSTINRRLTVLLRIMNLAKHNWGYAVTDLDVSRYMLKEAEARTRWLSYDDAAKLVECSAEHLKPIILFALNTGLRAGNILGLCWEQIDFKQGIIRFQIKSDLPGGKFHCLPITREMMQILQDQVPQKKGRVFVRRFTKAKRDPEPIKKLRNSFKTACRNAGIEDFHFHDLRHTAATWMRRNGVPLEVIQEILGHSNIRTTRRYAHVEMDDKKNALEILAASQIRHNLKSDRLEMVEAKGFEPMTPCVQGNQSLSPKRRRA